MKLKITLCFLLTMSIYESINVQSYNGEKIALTNFITRMYNS